MKKLVLLLLVSAVAVPAAFGFWGGRHSGYGYYGGGCSSCGYSYAPYYGCSYC